MSGVANVGHRLQDVGQVEAPVVPAHIGTAGCVVDRHRIHTGQLPQVLLVQPHAGGAGDALEDQGRFPHMWPGLAHEALLDSRIVIEPELIEEGGHRFLAA